MENLFDKGVKPLNCCDSECNFTAKSHSELKVHVQRTHEGHAKSAECLFCKTTCESNSDLKNHIDMVHSVKIYQCSHCELQFKHQMRLTEHFLKFHSRKRQIKCKLCVSRFSSQETLDNHIEKYHGKQKQMSQCHICRQGSLKKWKEHLKIIDYFINYSITGHRCKFLGCPQKA